MAQPPIQPVLLLSLLTTVQELPINKYIYIYIYILITFYIYIYPYNISRKQNLLSFEFNFSVKILFPKEFLCSVIL